MRSFEAVFIERGADGQPNPLWDRKTGAIDPDVARSWEKYDIRLVIERNWKTLAPRLRGKIHVYMGEMDSFYLDGATRRLKQALAALGSDAVVGVPPGKDHGTLMTTELRARITAGEDGGDVQGGEGRGVSRTVPMHVPTLGIVGLGLIGRSIALTARKRGLVDSIVGCDRNEEVLAARGLGMVDEATTDLCRTSAKASLVIVCTPVDRIIDTVTHCCEYVPAGNASDRRRQHEDRHRPPARGPNASRGPLRR